MKIVLYQCDWCGVREAARNYDEWPATWSNLDEHGCHDLLCGGCMAAGRKYIEQAIDDAKAYRIAVATQSNTKGEP